MVRNTIITGLVLLSGMCGITAQPTLVTAFDFPERAVLRDNSTDRLKYHIDGDWHIVSSHIWQQEHAIAYNAATGETKNTNYIIESEFDLGSEKRYQGRPVTGQGSWTYLRLLSDGTFQPVTPLPAFPEFVHEDKAYGIDDDKLFEMRPLTGENNVLFEFPEEVSTNHCDYYYEDGVLYIAYVNGLLSYHYDGDSLYAPYEAYFANKSLELIPWSVLDGKFLFYERDAVHEFRVHEMGHNAAPRLLPQGSAPPEINPIFWYTSNPYVSPQITSGYEPFSIAHGENITWLGILRGAISDFKTSYVFRIDRQPVSEGVDQIANFRGSIKSNSGIPASINGFKESREVLALGQYGDAGFEPYGNDNGTLGVLNDLYEGPMGSVAYANEAHAFVSSRFHRIAEYIGYQWFPANSSYFGMELMMSDGTPGGTRMLADLEPGIKGLRAVDFAFAGETLHTMVQKDDHSIAIYSIGSDIPEVPEIPEPSVDWETLFSNMDGSGYGWNWNTPGVQSALAYDGDKIGYLSDYVLPNQNYLQLDLSSEIDGHLLTTVDAQTGEILNKKVFKALENSDWDLLDRFLLPRNDGGYTAVFLGYPGYFDPMDSVAFTFQSGMDDAVFSVDFNAELEFEAVRLLLDERFGYDELIFAFARPDDTFGVLVEPEGISEYELHIFSRDGTAIKQIDIPRLRVQRERVDAWLDSDNRLHIANYSAQHVCEDCPVRILSFDSNLNPVQGFTAVVHGRILSPRIHDMPGDELWFTGALEGSIQLPGRSIAGNNNSIESEVLRPFAVRTIKSAEVNLDVKVYDIEMLNYRPSFVHEGSVFIHYLRGDYEGAPFTQVISFYNFFNPPSRDVYEIAQLNDFAEISQFHETPIEVAFANKAIYPTQFITDDGKWIRAFQAESYNVVHVNFWKHPTPIYHDNFCNRLQLVKTNWPFEPLPSTIAPSMADENGSHMHIFPNPNDGNFIIMPRGGANKIPYENLRIHDMQGRLVYARPMRQDFSYKEVQLPADLAKGVYHVVFSGPDVQESVRMVIAE